VEITDYLDILKRRKNILIAVPTLAVLLVVGFIVAKPKQYQATATVAAPALVGGASTNQYSGANGPKAFVSNFEAAVTSPPIVDAVARQTGASKGRVKSGLTATEIGSSSLMQVTYQTPKHKEAVRVAQAAAAETVQFLFRTQVQLTEQPVAGAQKALADAQADIANLSKETGLVVPDKDYEVRAQQIATLQSAQAQAIAGGQSATASRLQTQIDQQKQALAAMGDKVQQYQALTDRKNVAVTQLNQAQTNLQLAQGQLAAADPQRVVTVSVTHPVSVIGDVIQKGMVAGFAGLILAVGIIAALELLERSRQPDQVEVPSEWQPVQPVQPAAPGQEPYPSRV
jgi:capsular polysaccharide biosynthesis protein